MAAIGIGAAAAAQHRRAFDQGDVGVTLGVKHLGGDAAADAAADDQDLGQCLSLY